MVEIPSKKSKKPRAQKIERLSEEVLNKPFPKSKQVNIGGDKPFTITSYSAVEYNSIKSPANQKDVLDRIDDRIKVLEKGSRWLFGAQGRYLLGGLILFGLASTYYRSTQLSKRENVFESN